MMGSLRKDGRWKDGLGNDSLWMDGIDTTPRPPLDGDTDADVAIIGAGYTGLWTAYYLRQFAPGLRVLVIEAAYAGYGASGRNGGWCSAELPASLPALAARHGRPAAIAMALAARDAVDVIGKAVADEAIDCGWSKDGSLRLARNHVQRARLDAQLSEEREFGIEDGWRPLAAPSLAVPGLVAAAVTPHCAAVQPARLARGLADAVVRHGAGLVEGTRALELSPGTVRTDHGTVRARTVVRATEAYTGSLRGHARRVAALSSHLVATEPIPDAVWRETGWPGRATVTELRILFPYLQRTADNRLVLGGRSIGYRYGSATATQGSTRHDRRVRDLLCHEVGDIFPALAGASVTHSWTGVLGAYRDFEPGVSYDKATGLAEAGGYVGDGVALSNLAGRTLAALITGTERPETRLCWTGQRSRRWVPEPWRYLGLGTVAALARSADTREQRTGRPAGLRGKIVTAAMS
jgi:glycine/D-amino acid oxidase-like deaminating enzyme